MVGRLISLVTWLLVLGSLGVIMGGLAGRPFLLAAVPSSSMEPVLHPGDLIVVAPLLGRRLEKGQIVVFKTDKDDTWIVHRIIGGDETTGFITQGDANQKVDDYRVFPRHVAGTVPVISGRVAKLSGLGALSLDRGPLSSPYAAAVAMVLGIYLLASDEALVRRRLQPEFGKRRRGPGLARVLSLYLALGLGVSLLTYLSTWSLSSIQAGVVETVRVRHPGSVSNLLLVGEERRERIPIENPSRVPLIVGLSTAGTAAHWEQPWVYLAPGGREEVTLVVTGTEPGRQKVILRQGVHLPFLPLPVLRLLGRVHWHLPAVTSSLVPLVLMLIVGLTDRRVAGQLRQFRLALSLRAR